MACHRSCGPRAAVGSRLSDTMHRHLPFPAGASPKFWAACVFRRDKDGAHDLVSLVLYHAVDVSPDGSGGPFPQVGAAAAVFVSGLLDLGRVQVRSSDPRVDLRSRVIDPDHRWRSRGPL